jgi:hypothetical protein
MRDFLNEDSAGFWSDAKLNRYINLANQRVNSIISNTREDWFTTSATFTTAAGTKTYAMPSDCRFIRRMEIYDPTDASDITKLDELRFPRTESGGEWLYGQTQIPKAYTIREQQFDLLPTPDGTYNMRIYYDFRNTDLGTDTATPASPIDFHDMIIFLACLYAKKQNEDDDSWYGEMFRTRREELLSFILSRGSDDPKCVEGFLEGVV